MQTDIQTSPPSVEPLATGQRVPKQSPELHSRSSLLAPRPSAFTLVEMLVVITIIGILVALGGVAVFRGLEAAKKGRIKAEITNLHNAVEAYKQKYGDYPPSNMDTSNATAKAAIERHLARAFPRCDPAVEVGFIPKANGSTMGDPMSPAQALVFWLTSYTKDPVHPLSAKTEDRISFFDFDKTRLGLAPGAIDPTHPGWAVVGGNLQCMPPFYKSHDSKGLAYMYFESRSYFDHAKDVTGNPAPVAIPYLAAPWDTNTANNQTLDVGAGKEVDVVSGNAVPTSFQKLCANPKSFQIIAPGLDGEYGVAQKFATITYGGTMYKLWYKSFPDGIGYDTSGADDDNLTNFSEKPLGDARP